MSSKKNKQTKKAVERRVPVNNVFLFKKQNYMLLGLSVLVLIIGFFIMGSGKDQPFDAASKITVAPLVVLFGFALGVFSIIYTPKDESNNTPQA